jgi:hypothetical protein
MRDMVEQGQTSGSRQTTVLSGDSSSSRLTKWISVATPMTEPARCRRHAADQGVGRAGEIGHLHHVVGALGMDHDDPTGVLGPESRHVLGPEALVDRAVALPQQQRRLLDLEASVSPPRASRGFQTRMSSAP